MHDSRSHFIAYVPPGSIEHGRQLATTGGSGKTAPCTGPQVMTERCNSTHSLRVAVATAQRRERSLAKQSSEGLPAPSIS